MSYSLMKSDETGLKNRHSKQKQSWVSMLHLTTKGHGIICSPPINSNPGSQRWDTDSQVIICLIWQAVVLQVPW